MKNDWIMFVAPKKYMSLPSWSYSSKPAPELGAGTFCSLMGMDNSRRESERKPSWSIEKFEKNDTSIERKLWT
jgi:hypothetical protein